MFATNSPNAIEHVNVDCHCAPCQNTCSVEKTNDVKTAGVTTEKYRDNVIPITAAIKSARQVSKVTFNYPMLECS